MADEYKICLKLWIEDMVQLVEETSTDMVMAPQECGIDNISMEGYRIIATAQGSNKKKLEIAAHEYGRMLGDEVRRVGEISEDWETRRAPYPWPSCLPTPSSRSVASSPSLVTKLVTNNPAPLRGNSYFAEFPSFVTDATTTIEAEFARFTTHQGWRTETKKQKQDLARHRQECYAAELTLHYGNHPTQLEDWQSLCEEVGIQPAPLSITQCKKALDGVLVNIVDLLNQRGTGRPITKFESLAELRAYTTKERTTSKDMAKAHGFITVLLHTIS